MTTRPRTPARSLARALLALGLCAGLVAASAAAAAGGDPALEALLQKKAPTIVCIRYVLKVKLSLGGQSHDQEMNREIRGAVVDGSGLVVVGHDALEGGISSAQVARLKQRGGEVSMAPGDLKVLFGSDAKEHEAVVVAKDSRLGLTYLQLVEEGVTPPGVVDLAAATDLGVGQALFVVTRKARGFDCAPVLSRILVSGKVEKPRAMWAAIADTSNVGLPVYDASGAVAGVLVTQQGAAGVEDEGSTSSDPFVLPLDVVAKSVEQAKKRVPEVLAKAREAKEAASKEASKPDASKEPAPAAMDGDGKPSEGMGTGGGEGMGDSSPTPSR